VVLRTSGLFSVFLCKELLKYFLMSYVCCFQIEGNFRPHTEGLVLLKTYHLEILNITFMFCFKTEPELRGKKYSGQVRETLTRGTSCRW
jgi:hypothetical protein